MNVITVRSRSPVELKIVWVLPIGSSVRNVARWFALAVGVLVVAHPFLDRGGRAWTYLISVALSIPPTAVALRGTERGARLPFGLLLSSMAVLTVGGAVTAFG